MTKITPELLVRQRNFFLLAIALICIPDLLLEIYALCTTGALTDEYTLQEFILDSAINAPTMLALSVYGYYMGKQGYLKKYVSYAFVIFGIYYIIAGLILPNIPAVKPMIDSMTEIKKDLYFASWHLVGITAMIVSVKGSAMSRLMKWVIGPGFFGLLIPIIIMMIIMIILEVMAVEPALIDLYGDILLYVGFIFAAVLILLYYNRRIKEQE